MADTEDLVLSTVRGLQASHLHERYREKRKTIYRLAEQWEKLAAADNGTGDFNALENLKREVDAAYELRRAELMLRTAVPEEAPVLASC